MAPTEGEKAGDSESGLSASIMNSLSVLENVPCMGCGCVCDDLRLTVQGERIVQAERACSLAEPWLYGSNRSPAALAEIDGESVPLETAVCRSAELLRGADYPLVYGLSRSSSDGQRAAIALAMRLGAVIDTTASLCHAPSVVAQQQVGKVTCTLGEVRNRADLVVYWGSDPLVTHPRHWERYAVSPPGRFVPRGRADRFVVVADTRRTASADEADLFLPIEPGRHFEALWTLRAIVRKELADGGNDFGSPRALLTDLAERMRRSRWGAVFFGVELARGEVGHCNVQALLQMVTDLNAFGRWCAMRMRIQANVVGADSVMLWQTGYPFAVNMARGYPRYNPGEYSVQGLLERKEIDACLLIGSETLNWLTPKSLEHLHEIPLVVLDPAGTEPAIPPAVRIATATAGLHYSGTVYRMDGVPVPVRPVLPTTLPSDAEVLEAIEHCL